MPQINNLLELLIYTVNSLDAAEQQIENAMPAIIDKVHHRSLKNALTHHLGLTTAQRSRLKEIPRLIKDAGLTVETVATAKMENKGITGLLAETNELLSLGLATDVSDAVIICCIQKIEHYEICSYGTALAYAEQLKLKKVANLLNETLDEEYDVDDLLTALATSALNKEAITDDIEVEEKVPEDFTGNNETDRQAKVSISERSISSPGGRAGTSHRRYANGESRGH